MREINMELYGLSGQFVALSAEYPSLSPGRILAQEKGMYRVVSHAGEQLAQISGKLRHDAATACDFPVVGDFAMLASPAAQGPAIIQHILPRKSLFIRKAPGTGKEPQLVAANVDLVFLCMALNADFNLRRLERYLSIAWESGAKPVVVLTKSDLCADIQQKRAAVERIATSVDILTVSAMEQDGLEHILPYLKKGQTIALLGSSGVGKSTLINQLLGENKQQTNSLGQDGKGRHTTTRRELLLVSQGGMVIDTPGMRELGIWDAAQGVGLAFSEIQELAKQCRFRDCSHTGEPGCAVLAARRAGTLSEERWLSYQKLKAESAYAEHSQSYLEAKNKKFKAIAKQNKASRNP